MPPPETHKHAAIMFTDMADFSRETGADEACMLRLLKAYDCIIRQAVAEHHGTVVKTIGAAFLVDFPSVTKAVQCAQQIQTRFRAHNAENAPAEQIHVRVGIHLGDMAQRNGKVFGDGVHTAIRLQQLAEPDTVCISQRVYEEVAEKLLGDTVVPLGRPKLKNISERFQVYALWSAPPRGWHQTLHRQRLKLKQWRHSLQMTAAMVILGLVSVGALALRDRPFPPSSAPLLPDNPSIIVLPFVNMSGDPEQEYFSDGITEDLTSDLSKISSLFVIAHNSASTYKGKAVKAQDISQELDVRYVLEGSVRKARGRVWITAHLVDTPTGGSLWSERYDRPVADLFVLQDEIVREIATTLRLQLTLWEQETLVRKHTDSLEAYDYFLRGAESFNRLTQEANAAARRMYEMAIETDPMYAQAYAFLGFTYLLDWFWQQSPDPQPLERAFELAQQAIALDDSLATAHSTLGLAYLFKRQHAQAIAEVAQALALDPNNPVTHLWLGDILAFAGQPDEALGWLEKAIRLNPHAPATYLNDLGWAYLLVGRYEEAVATLKQALSRDSNHLAAYLHLACAHSALGREQEARADTAAVLRLSPNFSLEALEQMWPYKDPAALERNLAVLRKVGLR